MEMSKWQRVRGMSVALLVGFLGVNCNLMAQTHVVSPAELQKEAVAVTQAHQRNVEAVTQFLSSPRAKKALRSAHLDPKQVTTAVASLSDEELAQLASRAGKAQADFAAGDLSDHDLMLILVGIAVLVLIIVAVRG